MSAGESVDSILRLLAILTSWPVILLFLTLVFRKQIIGGLLDEIILLIRRIKKVTIAKVPIEFNEAAVSAFTETIQTGLQERGELSPESQQFILKQRGKFTETVNRSELARPPLVGRSILWVDDQPSNNAYEMNLLRELGARITPALTTAAGLEQLEAGSFDLIVSDVFRAEDGEDRPTAGYEFLDKLRARRVRLPAIIYTTNARSKTMVPEVVSYGARVADLPRDLIGLIVEDLSTQGRGEIL